MGVAILVFSLLGSILLVMGFTPQVIKTWKTKNTQHLSWLMWVLIDIACVFFIIFGIGLLGQYALSENKPVDLLISALSLIISNLIVGIEAGLVTFWKFKHMQMAKKQNISEEEIIKSEIAKKQGGIK